MAGTFGQKQDTDDGGWNNNKEMNPAANSSVTDDGLLESQDQDGDKSWRDTDVNAESGDPGRIPGSAEGEDEPEYTNT